MGLIGNVVYYSFHPSELRSIIQWFVASAVSRGAFDLLHTDVASW